MNAAITLAASDPTRAPTRDPSTLAENDKDKTGNPIPDGYQAFLTALRDQTIAFDEVQWVRVDVDPNSRGVFSFQPQIIAANAAS